MVKSKTIYEVLDEAKWGSGHWKLFTVVSLNYFLDGVMFAIAPLLAYIVCPSIAPIVFALNLVAETIGSIVFGRLADIVGRRVMFMISLALEVASLILLFPLYSNPIAFTILTSTMTFGIGGEFGAAYAAIAELTPARHRGKALMLSTNFWNVGSAVIAGLLLFYQALSRNPRLQVEYLLASALGTAIAVGLSRIAFPESPRWLLEKGRSRDAIEVVRSITGYAGEVSVEAKRELKGIGLGEAIRRYWFRFLVLAVITVSQYVTYDIVAYYLPYAPGFILGASSAPLIVFLANTGASIGALLLIPLIDYARRLSTLLSFTGGTLTAIGILVSNLTGNSIALYTIVFVNMVFSEWAWASLSVLQSELFPTGVRASVVGLLTGLQGVSGALIVYVEGLLNAIQFLAIVVGLWAAGLVASLAWYVRGVESARKPVEQLL